MTERHWSTSVVALLGPDAPEFVIRVERMLIAELGPATVIEWYVHDPDREEVRRWRFGEEIPHGTLTVACVGRTPS